MWNLPDGRERQVTFENRDVIGEVYRRAFLIFTPYILSPFSWFLYHRPASAFYWTGIKDFILFISDNDGDENTMMFKQNISEVSKVFYPMTFVLTIANARTLVNPTKE